MSNKKKSPTQGVELFTIVDKTKLIKIGFLQEDVIIDFVKKFKENDAIIHNAWKMIKMHEAEEMAKFVEQCSFELPWNNGAARIKLDDFPLGIFFAPTHLVNKN